MLEGDLRVGFTEENGGIRAIINDISQGDVTFFPQGLVHYQQNLGCSPATFVAALSSEDPGVSYITTNLFNLPIEAIKARTKVDLSPSGIFIIIGYILLASETSPHTVYFTYDRP